MTPAAAIECRNLTVRFFSERRVVEALRGIDLEVGEGELLSLLGPSGCGKSTLLRVVADLLPGSEGEIRVLGGTPVLARERRDIGFVFQDAALLPWRTVLGNVSLPLEVGQRGQGANGAANGMANGKGNAKPNGHAPKATPRELLQLVGLAGWENAYPHELSGGMRQRVSIARALVSSPRILLMDEPFGALDEITRDRMNDELLRVWRETKTTILFVTHSIYEAAYLGQRVMVMATKPGRIQEIVQVDLPGERVLSQRESPEFVALAAKLRVILEHC
jgi:NitT/TauT family transport system ATP-binding protein